MRNQLAVWLCLVGVCLAYSYNEYEQYRQDPQLAPRGFRQQPPSLQDRSMYARAYPSRLGNQYPSYRSQYQQQEPSYPAQDEYVPRYADDQPYDFIQQDESQMMMATGDEAAASTGGSVPSPTANTPTPVPPSVQTPAATQTSADSSSPPSSSPPDPTPTTRMDPLDLQLAAAMEAVKADMISKGKQVLEEKQWTEDVKGIMEQYQKKITNVYINIEKLKADMGKLYIKKQQIRNAQIQKELSAKLMDSQADLTTVKAALEKVTNTESEFEQSKKDIQSTIDSIYSQLAELKGTAKDDKSKDGDKDGEDAATSEDTSDSSSSKKTTTKKPAAAEEEPADVSDQDIVDKKAEISSKIDTIKSIVDALNSPSSSL